MTHRFKAQTSTPKYPTSSPSSNNYMLPFYFSTPDYLVISILFAAVAIVAGFDFGFAAAAACFGIFEHVSTSLIDY